jgi:hypothetical protein
MQNIILSALLLLTPPQEFGGVPGAISDFCRQRLGSQIARMGGLFNPSDAGQEGIPKRRILGYSVTSSTSFLWYEHGGRGYHQHLVRFDTLNPNSIQASFVFIRSKHKDIYELLGDEEFLKSSRSPENEL